VEEEYERLWRAKRDSYLDQFLAESIYRRSEELQGRTDICSEQDEIFVHLPSCHQLQVVTVKNFSNFLRKRHFCLPFQRIDRTILRLRSIFWAKLFFCAHNA
jgi:hypothetical protein